jgi:pyruvate kinase
MKRYIHKEERFNQEKIDYKEYSEILNNKLCWAVMVARGDLGVEIEPAKVPQIQKEITSMANIKGKGVIVATQMLLSMVHNKRPSRADVTDIHNAVLCGADVVMLSEETAAGDYPIEALKYMRSIINKAVEVLMEPKNREIYLKKILEDKESEKANQIMDLLGEPMVNISLKSGSPVIFSYALTGGTVTKIPITDQIKL